MDKSLVTIGEFAKLCNVSKDTLFHYEAIDLFKPAYIDNNGYRYYHVLQFDSFLIIRQLHLAGMPLKEIKKYNENRNPDAMQVLYKDLEDDLNKKIKKLKFVKDRITNLRKGIEEGRKSQKDYLKTQNIPEITIEDRKLEKILLSDEIKEVDDLVMTKAISNLISKSKNDGYLSTLGMISSLDNKTNLESSIRFYLHHKNGDEHIDQGRYLSTYHLGNYESLYKTYMRLINEAKDKELSIDKSVFAETIIGDWAVKSPDEYVIKVFVKITD